MSRTWDPSDVSALIGRGPAQRQGWLPWWHLALWVCAGYYGGALLGLALTFKPVPISVLWPPNAILFGAMLLVPASRWWIIALAALPAHFASEIQAGVPWVMVLCWYVSNVSEAVIGACLTRVLIGDGRPFDTLRGVILFGLAAFAAAGFSSFLDSAFVVLNGWGNGTYWALWGARLLSNVTASLVVVPLIVTWGSIAWERPGRMRHSGRGEAAVIAAGIAVVALVVFNTDLAARTPPAMVCLPLPFLLWSSFRFGSKGASAALAAVALASIWGAGHNVGALGGRTPIENAISVQVFLITLAPTLLCLAAAMEERRRGVDALRQSGKRFQFVLDATHGVVYERNARNGRLWWTRNGPSHFGYVQNHLGDYADILWAIHPDDRNRVQFQHEQALRAERPHWEAHFRLRRANGAYAHVQEQGLVIRDADGLATHTIGAWTDVTERQEVAELSDRLSHAGRLTAMGEMAASIAHEINQPMSAILNNVDAAELLLDRGRLGESELRAILEDIRSDDLRASEIIRNIRNLARKHVPETAPFDVNEMLASTVRLLLPVARRRGVQLHAEYGAIASAQGDRIQVQQVVLNLAFNAMDAMQDPSPGARELTIVSSMDPSGMVRVDVRDTGGGIAPAQLHRIFESFFTTKPDGLGLGLSIARSLVQSHGGHIYAANNADRGATVGFTLPPAAT